MQTHQRPGFFQAEVQRLRINDAHLLRRQRPRKFSLGWVAADDEDAGQLRQLGQGSCQPGIKGRGAAQLLRVVQHQRPGGCQPFAQAPKTTPHKAGHIAQVVGCRQGQLHWQLAWLRGNGGIEKMHKGRRVGVCRIQLQPQLMRRTRSQITGHQGRFADTGRARNPNGCTLRILIKHSKQAITAHHQPQPRPAQLA